MEKKPTLCIVVAAALIANDGLVLLQKRPDNKHMGGLWEFPGGKLEPGEKTEAGLARELLEELDIRVLPTDLHPLTFASEQLASGQEILLLLFTCHTWEKEPRAMEGQPLCWLAAQDMYDLPMPPADAPFIPILEAYLKEQCGQDSIKPSVAFDLIESDQSL